jgi:hypothetical protein
LIILSLGLLAVESASVRALLKLAWMARAAAKAGQDGRAGMVRVEGMGYPYMVPERDEQVEG